MDYDQFTLPQAASRFWLKLGSPVDLFPDVPPRELPDSVRCTLRENSQLASGIGTKAARSQLLVGPLLTEVWRAKMAEVALFIGTRFDVDEAAGLTGVCDFILGRPPILPFVNSPVYMIVEIDNENISASLGKCVAAMVAAQKFNFNRHADIKTIYGAVSNGVWWRFLRLHDSKLDIEMRDRSIGEMNQIFGILLHICGITPAAPAAA